MVCGTTGSVTAADFWRSFRQLGRRGRRGRVGGSAAARHHISSRSGNVMDMIGVVVVVVVAVERSRRAGKLRDHVGMAIGKSRGAAAPPRRVGVFVREVAIGALVAEAWL